jgi:hypothetical protein
MYISQAAYFAIHYTEQVYQVIHFSGFLKHKAYQISEKLKKVDCRTPQTTALETSVLTGDKIPIFMHSCSNYCIAISISTHFIMQDTLRAQAYTMYVLSLRIYHMGWLTSGQQAVFYYSLLAIYIGSYHIWCHVTKIWS